MAVKEIKLDYEPQPKQKVLHETPAQLILYGGSAGGAKSHGMRWDLYSWCLTVPGIDTYLFRKTLPELEKNHIQKMRHEMPPELGTYSEQRKRFEFFNGSLLNMCFCETDDDVIKYQGAEMHVFGFDEAALAKPDHLAFLMSRNRLGGFQEKVPPKYRHLLPRAIFSSNPGGPAHDWLKTNFIGYAPPQTLFMHPLFKRPAIYIPSRMTDNKYLDQGYEHQFAGLAPERRKALVDGDWDAVVGQALHSLSREKHLIRSFEPPRHWTRLMSIDWGTAKPFSVGWYCVSDGAVLKGKAGRDDVWLPSGALIRYAEWYGWNGSADTGCRLESDSVARGIVEREKKRGEVIDYRTGDSQMWAQTDGISVAERMVKADPRMAMRPWKKDRKQGYSEFLSRLAGNPFLREDGKPGEYPAFYVTENCRHFWRTVPTLVLDDTDPDKGPDTKSEDHVYDEVVGAMRSRPYVQTKDDRWEKENAVYLREMKKTNDPYATH